MRHRFALLRALVAAMDAAGHRPREVRCRRVADGTLA